MITKVASQASWRFLKDVIYIIRGFVGRFTMSIEDSRKNVKIIIEEPRWKNLHHKLHKNIFDVIMSKLTLSFVTCFEDLHLQLTTMGMMHMLKIVKTYSKFYLIKVSQDEKVWEWSSMSFQNSLCTRHKHFNHSLN